MTDSVEIEWPGGTVTGVFAGQGDTGILLAHGAGTAQDHPAMQGLLAGLASGGHTVMTFNYPYTERGSKRPDPKERLLACHRAAADHLLDRVDHLFLAGRSMGGRMGTHLVADGYPARGLILYAYPLHPPGKPDALRVEQFEKIEVPMLFFQGTNDALARMHLFEEHISSLPNAAVEILEGAGHGPRGGGWTQESITERYVTGTLGWLDRLSSGKTGASAP